MKVMISAGEASGDMHAASVVDALVEYAATALPENTTLEFFGMGGTNLAESGMEILVDVDKNAVMGLLEVLHKYPSLRANLSTLRSALSKRKPDILVLVDYPHFNMKLATTAKSLGIPVLFFIAPKVWASRPGRVEELSKLVDHMAVILPFEKKIFNDAKIPCTYVGNPLLDNQLLIDASKDSCPSQSNTIRIALLPGSRKTEITMLLPPMLKAADKLAENNPAIEFVLPVAETIEQEQIEKLVSKCKSKISLIKATDYKLVSGCDASIVASGTATLELAILGVPMVVIYKLNQLSYKVLKRWLTIEFISLVNIIANREVVKELLQDEVTEDNLVVELEKLLDDDNVRRKQLKGLKSVSDQLGDSGASLSTAKAIVSLVKESRIKAKAKLKELATT